MTLLITLFLAGMLTILLPCILPLLPIVLGVSIAGRSKLRPLLTVLGMVVSFAGFTFLLLVVLRQFVELADYMRIATYYILLLFGVGFLTHRRGIQYAVTVLGAIFFLEKGLISVVVAAIVGLFVMHVGSRIASRIQQLGTDLQGAARSEFGDDNPMTAFLIGLTMGLVWVPCAGPALGFAFTLVREEPGLRALAALLAYASGTAVPLLLVGYGGQYAAHSVRAMSRYSGRVKQVAGALLIITALGFQYRFFMDFQTWLVNNTRFGAIGTNLEERLFSDVFSEMEDMANESSSASSAISGSSSSAASSADSLAPSSTRPIPTPTPNPISVVAMNLPKLPKLTRAPEFTGLGPWHNSEPFTMESLRGKVVLVDFWTYSCINCIRTLPYIQGYSEKFQDKPFVLIGVHTPEFVFEKSQKNVADAIKRHGLTYPVAQDNDFGTWDAFANRYWPAKYLIDADGYIRYTHFGEGEYDETDLAIQSLLAEIGVDPTGDVTKDPEEAANRERTPETYLGSRSWPALGNAQGDPTAAVVTYGMPKSMERNFYYLVGDWQLTKDEERQVLRSPSGEIRMRFSGSEINLVMGMESEDLPDATVEVLVDGKKVKNFTIDRQDLFALWSGDYGEHDIVLRISGAGAEGYAFTFGS